MKKVLGYCSLVLAVAACGSKKDSTSGALSGYPAIGTLALEALPKSLQPATLAVMQQPMGLEDFAIHPFAANDATQITSFGYVFSDTYATISGGSYVGLINSLLQDMDSRFQGLSKQFSTAPACAANAAKPFSVDLSAAITGHTALADTMKLSLDVQCYDMFSGGGGDVSGTGSGLLYGNKGNDYSIMLVLNAKGETSSGFGYAAKVTDKDADDETVDMIFGQGRPATGSNTQEVIRLRAQRKKKIYEFALASTGGATVNATGTNAHSPNMGCALRAITDGTHIYTSGIALGAGACPTTAGAGSDNMDICLNASDLSADNTASACDTLKASFTIGAYADLQYLNAGEITDADGTAIFNGIQIDTDAAKAAAASDQK